MSFMFKGISSENYFEVGKIQRSLLPPITRNTVQIPGRPGEVPQNSNLGMAKFVVPIRIKEENVFSFNEAKRVIARWLFSDKPEEFILTKDPNIYYNAYLEGETDLDEILKVGKGTLNFIAPDPIGFDRIETTGTLVSESSQVKVGGTYKTFPYLKFTVKRDITFLAYMGPNEKDAVVLGQEVDIDTQTAKPKEELVFDDDMQSLTGFGWSAGSTIIDGGQVAGEMIATNQTFTYNDIGTGTKWHGPAIKKGLDTLLDDWKVECWLKFDTTKDIKMIARAEIYLLDANGACIAKFALKDIYRDIANTVTEFRAGDISTGQYIIKSWGAKRGVYNDFWGLLSLKKVGKTYECYITKIVNGKHTTRMFKRYTDVKSKYSTPKLAQIELHIAGTGTSPIPTNDRINFDRLKVWKVNTLTEPAEVPIIARAGDVIELDHYTKEVLINGEPRKDLLDPISKLFPMEGTSAITIYPFDAVTAEISYRSRWL